MHLGKGDKSLGRALPPPPPSFEQNPKDEQLFMNENVDKVDNDDNVDNVDNVDNS